MAGQNVLVVEDSPTMLRLVTASLEKEGYQVLTAEDGEQALQVATISHPDLIVLDIVLPKKNGFQVCRQLRSMPQTRDIKILMLSSKDQESDRFWGIKQGADDYLTKPYADAELLARVRSLL